jgi:BrnA antitoxin of type II toxin-antitoxin system
VVPPGKASVHLLVDADVLAWFKAQGRGHLTRMNAVLRADRRHAAASGGMKWGRAGAIGACGLDAWPAAGATQFSLSTDGRSPTITLADCMCRFHIAITELRTGIVQDNLKNPRSFHTMFLYSS